jgi:putative ABC transport system permease protein
MLLHDRATTAGSVLGVVAIIFLVGQQMAILFGLLGYMSVLVDHSGGDIWVLTQNAQSVNASGSLPVRYVDRLAGVEGVDWARPVVATGGLMSLGDGRFQGVQVVGASRPELEGGPWSFAEGSIDVILDYDGVTVDQTDLSVLGNPPIDGIREISGIRARIAGYTKGIRGFEGTLVFTNIDKAREIGGIAADRCSHILVNIEPGRRLSTMVDRIQEVLPRAEVLSSSDLSTRTRVYYLTNTGIGGSFGFTTLVGTLVGIVIITLTMYTTVLNREKDFAVLRALGARKRDVRLVIFLQAAMIGTVGIVVGFVLLSLYLNGVKGSSLPSHLPLWLPPVHAGFTLLLCLIGSLLAMRRAIRIEPASAFR